MSEGLVFIGDIHGDIEALKELIFVMEQRGDRPKIFLGDYINKGVDSKSVVDLLLSLEGNNIFLQGNHEYELLQALKVRSLGRFLNLGGAAMIRSYLGRKAKPAVLDDFMRNLPAEHFTFFETLDEVFLRGEIGASHDPKDRMSAAFWVSGHSPVKEPYIGKDFAEIDTSDSGTLTAFYWPEREFTQVLRTRSVN